MSRSRKNPTKDTATKKAITSFSTGREVKLGTSSVKGALRLVDRTLTPAQSAQTRTCPGEHSLPHWPGAYTGEWQGEGGRAGQGDKEKEKKMWNNYIRLIPVSRLLYVREGHTTAQAFNPPGNHCSLNNRLIFK